ncbi:MAG TPA: DUF3152 domain-containing protein [Microlunatus sp.]|nr:DUF3152 domain-containing protein [Microlunatus sp.]
MVAAVLVWGLAVTVGIVAWANGPKQSVGAVPPVTAVPPARSETPATPEGPASASPPASSPPASEPDRSERPSRSDPPKKKEKPDIPAAGSGTYHRQQHSAKPKTRRGQVITYDVRVEKGLPYDVTSVAKTIHKILNDERSWTGTGEWRFELVGPGEEADLHAYLATPGTTDELCAPLDTGGELSCRNGEKVVLNAKRWAFGAKAYGDDVANYRRYLVNHEFGHALGFGHVDCPDEGRPAPVMMQQTKGLDGCRANPWPSGDD